MSNFWVVVADSTRSCLFHQSEGQSLEEFDVMLNPEARLREQDLVSDETGRGLNRVQSETAKNVSRLDVAAIRGDLPEYLQRSG